MTKFEEAVIKEVKRVREQLQENENLHQFEFCITASGRIHDGEVKIEFAIGEYSANVSANSVDAAVAEYQRRKGFERRHSGLVLTGPGTIDPNDTM
jgi:hypothetical protein